MTLVKIWQKWAKIRIFSWSWIPINHHSRFVNHCICSGVWSMLNTLVCWGGVMAADSDNEMRDFTDSEGEQERWEERRVQGLVSGLSKCRPFYAPNIFARVICLWNLCFLWLFRSPQNPRVWCAIWNMNHCLPRCLGRFLSRLSDCLRNDLYNVEPLKKKHQLFFLPSKTHKYFTCRSLSSFPHRNLITFQSSSTLVQKKNKTPRLWIFY